MAVPKDEAQDEQDLLRVLSRSGVWEHRQEAEAEFREPVNVLAAQASLFDDGDLPSQDSGLGAERGSGSLAAGSAAPPFAGAHQGPDAGASGGAGGVGAVQNEVPEAIDIDDSDDDSWLG